MQEKIKLVLTQELSDMGAARRRLKKEGPVSCAGGKKNTEENPAQEMGQSLIGLQS